MNKKKILTADLEIGMVTAEAVYNFSNHLIISSNTTLTPDIIDKLKYYSIKSVKILLPDDNMETSQNGGNITYFQKIQHSQEFKIFETEFNSCVNDFKGELNDLVVKNGEGIINNMLEHVAYRVYLSISIEYLELLRPHLERLAREGKKVVLLINGLPEREIEGSIVYQTDSTDDRNGQLRLIVDSSYVLTGEMTGDVMDSCLYCGQKNFVNVFKESLRNEIKLIELSKGEQ